ncbi:MAG: AraC family transcriptional regulator [Anaerolineae bacterium]|nr:AraC family transcriptional regulator [Anaerolineae bacterium]
MKKWIETNDVVLWPEAVRFGDVVYPPGGAFGPRIQPTIELVLLHSGEMTVWIDGVRHYAPAATITLLFPGHEERFVFAADSETHHSFAHITLEHLPPLVEVHLRSLPWSLPLSTSMTDLMSRGLSLRTATLSTVQPLLKAIAAQMLWRYIGEGERLLAGEDAPQTHPAVEQVRKYIQNHLSEALTLDDLAAVGAVSPSHLIRLFQVELNTTPIAYLWEQRVAQGIDMLENTGLPVGIIAERCGFQTSYHFSRRVRLATGYAPLSLRRRAWQGR